MAKKKHQGHYCHICGEYKASEKFTGKGRATHVCKSCQSLPAEVKSDLMRCCRIDRIFDKFHFTRSDWELLEKYAKKFSDKESGRFAQDILDSRRGLHLEEVNDNDEYSSHEDLDILPEFR
jgi:hypothetical protein